MKYTTLFVIALVAFATSTQIRNKIHPLQEKSFGNIFAEIRAQIAAGGPYEQITGMIDDLENQIKGEQAEHMEMFDAANIRCKEEHDFRTNEIIEAESALRRATLHRTQCDNSHGKALVDLATNQQDQIDAQAYLALIISVRAQENELFTANVARHKGAIAAVEGAIDIVDEMTAGEATLIQLSQHSSNLLKTGIAIHQAAAYAPAVALLAQMATSDEDMFTDEGAVSKIREMLEGLIVKVQDALAADQLTEAIQLESFTKIKNNTEANIRDLKANEVRLSDHIDAMEQCVLEEDVIISKSKAKFERNSSLLKAAQEMCSAMADEYATATAARKEELELLVVVRGMVNKRLGGVGQSVKSRDEVTDWSDDHTEIGYSAGEFDHEGGDASDNLNLA